jgi:hypothetical protein
MTQFITDPATVCALLGFSVWVSIALAVCAYLWQLERDNVNDLTVLLDDSKATNKALADTNAHLSDILSRAYVRNKYGTLQGYQDWAINGDRKPRPRRNFKPKTQWVK